MSYSLSVRGATKLLALAALAAAFDEKVVTPQPVHAKDRDAVLANAKNAADLVVDSPDKDISISINGYLSWSTPEEGGEPQFSHASISASASVVAREAT